MQTNNEPDQATSCNLNRPTSSAEQSNTLPDKGTDPILEAKQPSEIEGFSESSEREVDFESMLTDSAVAEKTTSDNLSNSNINCNSVDDDQAIKEMEQIISKQKQVRSRAKTKKAGPVEAQLFCTNHNGEKFSLRGAISNLDIVEDERIEIRIDMHCKIDNIVNFFAYYMRSKVLIDGKFAAVNVVNIHLLSGNIRITNCFPSISKSRGMQKAKQAFILLPPTYRKEKNSMLHLIMQSE